MSQKVIKLYVRIITCFAITLAIFSGSEVILKFSSNGSNHSFILVYAVQNAEQQGFPYEANDVIEIIIDKQKSLVQFSKHDHFSNQADLKSFKVGLNIDATMSLYI